MPTYKVYPENPPEEEIKSKFAFFPTTDMNGYSLWLEPYWEYGGWCEIGFYVFRGPKKSYSTKERFWNSIRFRIPYMMGDMYKR